ncbi:beta-galactosidase [Actinoplanes sp. NPDC051411]|uniref:beta-galactosidase n=1 Tax=Actinoplanes sp. NPDC051411 TaxID=3155522 RepID=UPI0034168EA2
MPVQPRRRASLGISFRPLQAEAFGLDPDDALRELLTFPFETVRLAAYWDRIETAPDKYDFAALDRQVEAAEDAGKRIILCAGAVKTFGYPEFFVPPHHLPTPLPEGVLITPQTHGALLDAACAFLSTVVARYRGRPAVTTWQVEHEATDPLGMEHSWRLSQEFVAAEVAAVRAADPSRPVLLNGFLPMSAAVAAQQWWRTRDQGDSLVVAEQLADVIGLDVYPRHAVLALGRRSVYLDGSRSPWQTWRPARIARRCRAGGRRLLVAEGQAEPWEAVTVPPSPEAGAMSSCPPERLITNYNVCLRQADRLGVALDDYLFWGAEYWLLRDRHGDSRYLSAFARVLTTS